MTMGKVVLDHEQLAKILRVFKAQGKSIVVINGCFDLLHVGHVRALQDAASRGHYLVVALNSDASVQRLKGNGRPIQPEAERAELVAALEGVDYVTVFPEPTCDDLLRALRPTALAKGPEYTLQNLPEAATLREIGAELLSVGDPKDHATRDLIARIRGVRGQRNGSAKSSRSTARSRSKREIVEPMNPGKVPRKPVARKSRKASSRRSAILARS